MWDDKVFEQHSITAYLQECIAHLEEHEKPFLKFDRLAASYLRSKYGRYELLAVSWHGPNNETEVKKQKEKMEENIHGLKLLTVILLVYWVNLVNLEFDLAGYVRDLTYGL